MCRTRSQSQTACLWVCGKTGERSLTWTDKRLYLCSPAFSCLRRTHNIALTHGLIQHRYVNYDNVGCIMCMWLRCVCLIAIKCWHQRRFQFSKEKMYKSISKRSEEKVAFPSYILLYNLCPSRRSAVYIFNEKRNAPEIKQWPFYHCQVDSD